MAPLSYFKTNSPLVLKVLVILFIILIFVSDIQDLEVVPVRVLSEKQNCIHTCAQIFFQGIDECNPGAWLGKSEITGWKLSRRSTG